MDGNGRWATKRSLPRTAGHLEGLKALKRILIRASEIKLDFLTVYAFSTENWKRSTQEVGYLMNLAAKKLPSEIKFYQEYQIKILFRGKKSGLPKDVLEAIDKVENATSTFTRTTLCIALNYGGHDELVRAFNKIKKLNLDRDITAEDIKSNIDLPSVPAPDIICRSAGEYRISNFLLWDSAYAEFAFFDKLWPDWTGEDLDKCINILNSRERKFGGVK